jgi:hypothetical protein
MHQLVDKNIEKENALLCFDGKLGFSFADSPLIKMKIHGQNTPEMVINFYTASQKLVKLFFSFFYVYEIKKKKLWARKFVCCRLQREKAAKKNF